jgi:probable rRNA maturation factor
MKDAQALLQEAADTVINELALAPKISWEISLSLSDDASVQKLNAQFRGKDKPTNVLSFPSVALSAEAREELRTVEGSFALGDVILALETVSREAQEQDKTIKDHARHLLVHGVMHLFGYNHIDDAEAEQMEAIEIRILNSLGIDNPYESGEDGA